MIVKELYCFEREEGKVTVSTEKPECDYTLRYRLISNEGKQITKDSIDFTSCIDVSSIDDWYEVLAVDNENYTSSLAPDEISPEEFMALIEEAL